MVGVAGTLPRYTGGQVYYYPGFTPAVDGARFHWDLQHDLERETGWEAVMRIRCGKGTLLPLRLIRSGQDGKPALGAKPGGGPSWYGSTALSRPVFRSPQGGLLDSASLPVKSSRSTLWPALCTCSPAVYLEGEPCNGRIVIGLENGSL